ncbi:MAG TPA: ABC transporter substrate-binding protein [Candidatus Limnocylindrales bacterium]|nr:ABC transporter substrate-binding protein [Candidatus Limnocylindrales bacterium]
MPALLLLPLLILVVACSAGSASPSAGAFAPTFAATLALAPTTAAAAFPVTLTDDEGTAVTIPSKPQKIVSLTPASTEILFAIGAGPRVVATTNFDDYPPEAIPLPDVATFTSVDAEKIVGLGTDLVIAGGNNFNPPASIAKLRSLNIAVIVTYAKDVAGVLADIGLVGKAAGESAAADSLATSMSAQFDAIRAVTSGAPHPKVFYELDATSKIYTTTDASFLQEMVQIAGGDPITTGSTTNSEISLEQLIAANPAVIVLGDAPYGATPGQVKARPGWATIQAVQTGAIVGVDGNVIARPGPRLVLGLLDLLRAIHPEIALPSGLPSPVPAASPAASTP